MTRWPPPGCAASPRARNRTVGWSFFLRAESPGPRSVASGRPPVAAGRAPSAPPEARPVFGSALGLDERYAELLAGPGAEQGLIGPRETARLWATHLMNCAAVAGLVPHPTAGRSGIDLRSCAGPPGRVAATPLPRPGSSLPAPTARAIPV